MTDTLDRLNCGDDIFVSQMKPVDWRNLDGLVKAILDNAPIKNLPSNCPYVGKYDVGKLHFAVCAEPDKTDKSAYYVSDFFSEEVKLVASFENPELDGVEVPKYSILHKNELLNISNICFDKLLPAYQRFEMTPFLADCANAMLLELISAYDEASGTRQETLYNTAIAFAEWLLDTPDDMLGHNVKLLNKLQLIKRKRALTYEERAIATQYGGEFSRITMIYASAYIYYSMTRNGQNVITKDSMRKRRRHSCNIPSTNSGSIRRLDVKEQYLWPI